MLKLYVSCHLTMKDMIILLTCVPSSFNCVKVVYTLAPHVGCDLLWYLYVLLLFLTIHERLTLLNANCIDFSVQAVNRNKHLKRV